MRVQLIRCSLALAVTVFAACDFSTGLAAVAATSTATPNPVRLSESTEITVAVTNIGDRSITVLSPNDMCAHAFAIVDMNGRAADLAQRPCLAVVVPPIELAPGESVEYIEDWTPSSATLNQQPLPTGSYQIRPANLGEVSIRQGGFALLVVQP